MSKDPVYVNVTFSGTTVTCSPDDVQVSKKDNDCIIWVAQQAGYTFTGVTITDDTGDPNNTKEWDAPTFSTTNIPNPDTSAHETITVSTMTVNDKFKDTNDHSYTISYTTPNGASGSFDPGIKNRD